MNLSMRQKFALLQLPIFTVGVVVSFIAWETGKSMKANSTAQEINSLALHSAIYVADMGGAVKGYMLDPTNEGEAKAKKEADDNNVKAIEGMAKLSKDKVMLGLIKEIGDVDEDELNPAEDAIIKMVAQGKLKEAQDYFKSTYTPLRDKYNALSERILNLSDEQFIIARAEFEAGIRDGIYRIIGSLFVGILVSSILVIFTLGGVVGALNKVKARLTAVTGSFLSASTNVKDIAHRLSQTSAEAAAAIQESVSSMSEMSSMLKQTSQNTKETAALSSEVLKQSQNGVSVMAEMSESMTEISESSSRLKEIAKVIENIAAKTNVINDVVFKTQLLAVNAAIEAARAGHHGKGFAVVASEVSSLASLSGKASAEIRELLQTSATRVAEIIEGTATSIAHGEAVCSKSTDSFSVIAKSIASIAEKIGQISVASQEQEIGVNQTTTALTQMNRATTASNAMAQQNAKFGQEIADQSHNLNLIDRAMTLVVHGTEDGKAIRRHRSKIDRILDQESEAAAPTAADGGSATAAEAPANRGHRDEVTNLAVVSKFRKAAEAKSGVASADVAAGDNNADAGGKSRSTKKGA